LHSAGEVGWKKYGNYSLISMIKHTSTTHFKQLTTRFKKEGKVLWAWKSLIYHKNKKSNGNETGQAAKGKRLVQWWKPPNSYAIYQRRRRRIRTKRKRKKRCRFQCGKFGR